MFLYFFRYQLVIDKLKKEILFTLHGRKHEDLAIVRLQVC